MRILSIDPGSHIGIAIKNERYSTQLTKSQKHVWDLILQSKWDIILVESGGDFEVALEYRADTIELIGSIKSLLYAFKLPYKIRKPSDRKPCLEEAKSMLDRNTSSHEVDALAHILAWEKVCKENTLESTTLMVN